MTFNAASYFAGVGTVLATLTLGFGGGVLMSGVFTDKAPREPNRVERQMADKAQPEAPPAITTTPVVVPAAPRNETLAAAPPSAAPPEPRPAAPPAEPPVPQVQPPAQVTEVIRHPAPAQGRERPVALVHPGIREQARLPHDEKAQDWKRQATEKRKAEREKRRAERRRQQDMKEAERQLQLKDAQQASAAQRSRAAEIDDEDREERPLFGARERVDFPRPRLFPFFSTDD